MNILPKEKWAVGMTAKMDAHDGRGGGVVTMEVIEIDPTPTMLDVTTGRQYPVKSHRPAPLGIFICKMTGPCYADINAGLTSNLRRQAMAAFDLNDQGR